MRTKRFRPSLQRLENREVLTPAAPTNLVTWVASPSEINLSWDLGDATDTAVVIQRQAAGGQFQTLVTLPGGEDTYTDTSCWANSTYTYRVQARDATGASDFSASESATTQPIPVGSMLTVTDLTAVATSPTTATVTFSDPNTASGTHYYLLERSADGVYYQTVASLGTSTSFNDVGLAPGETFYYRLIGCSWSTPTSDYSAPVSVVMPTGAQGLPVAPAGLQIESLTANTVTLSWTTTSGSTAQYKIERAVYDPWHPMTWSQVGLTDSGALSFTDTGLGAEQAYEYRVRATNAYGDSDYAIPANDVMRAIVGAAIGVVTASQGSGSPKTYDIGPGQAYATIGSLDWTKLGPGDTVNIHYQPGGYHELLQISTRGTPAAWITINGVPDPQTGALPTLDGYEAVLAPQFVNHYAPVDGSGVIVVGARPGYVVGYKPGYVRIQNLQIQNDYKGNNPNTFTDYDGSTKSYGDVGAGIYLERADHITVANCVITNNGEGVFGAGQSGFDRLMTNITLDSNYIYGNGNVGSFHEHNTYLEGIDTLYQFNHYGPVRDGSGGAGLKDRGVGTIIRYNYIEGGAHQLQLPEAQNQSDLAMALPAYHKMYVYGNTLVAPPGDASSIIYYGGDQGLTPFYRKGTLYLYDNTLIANSDQSSVYKINAIDLASPGETVDARNNIIAAIPSTPGAAHSDLGLLGSDNNGYFGRNWITSGYFLTTGGGYTFTGHAAGLANLIAGTSIDPGFVNQAAGDYHLLASSEAANRSGRLAGSVAAYAVTQQYREPHTAEARASVADLGSFGLPTGDPGSSVLGGLSLTGPVGVGPLLAVAESQTMSYSIEFWNDSPADGPTAKQLTVAEQLDAELDWSTFEFGRVGFGSIVVSGGGQSFTKTVSTSNSDGTPLLVEVTGSMNPNTGAVTWTFRSLDPATNQPPTGAGQGFLPAGDSTGRGRGFLESAIRLKAARATGSQVQARAAATFDGGTQVNSNTVTNVVDSGTPSSSVSALPAIQTTQSFSVNWTGTDDDALTGISYDVYVSSDGGAFAAWQQQVTDASATFTGQYGHTYGFYSVATDGLGFREATPAAAQAVTALVAPFAGSASMTGPAGAGPLHAVVSGSTLSYSIGFQNDSAVGGPAIKQLVVTEQLDSTLDWSSFQFSRVGFGAVTVTGSGTSFQTTVSTTNADGMPLRVTVAGSVNMKTGVVTWTLRSIDPATNQTPTGPWAGFLPAADPTGRSKGFLECAIKLKAGLATGTEVRSQAAATFDGTTIASNNYSNVVDSGFPTSTVAPLPATQSVESFTVSWSGTDSAAQAGIAYYDVYVSTDGGRFRRWQARTTATSATFTGQFGHTYAFYSVATDALGFRLSTRAYAQATTSLNAPLRSPTQTRRGTRLFSFKP